MSKNIAILFTILVSALFAMQGFAIGRGAGQIQMQNNMQQMQQNKQHIQQMKQMRQNQEMREQAAPRKQMHHRQKVQKQTDN